MLVFKTLLASTKVDKYLSKCLELFEKGVLFVPLLAERAVQLLFHFLSLKNYGC